MALVLPLLLFAGFGPLDFGRMLATQLTLTAAAREGARGAGGTQADPRRYDRAADPRRRVHRDGHRTGDHRTGRRAQRPGRPTADPGGHLRPAAPATVAARRVRQPDRPQWRVDDPGRDARGQRLHAGTAAGRPGPAARPR